jgi:hypothetical protein
MSVVEIDWDAAAAVAEGLGRRTLILVAKRDAKGLQKWCLEMASVFADEASAVRSLSYFELAVLAGHRTRAGSANDRQWRDLQAEAQQLT